MRQFTAGSLFSGIGGIDLAFALAGFNILFQVEIDGFCQKVLAKHGPTYWPDSEIHTDVRSVGRSNLATVDVLFGGFPCQSISNAGKREGIRDGAASGLWFEFKRVIGEIRPRIVLLENVAAITSRDGVKVIGDLASMGYDARWGVISASDAGAPHQRDRWFCVAYTDSWGLGEPQRSSEFCHHGAWGNQTGDEDRQHVIYTPERDGEVGNPNHKRCKEHHLATESVEARFISGRPDETAKSVGDANGQQCENIDTATIKSQSPCRPDKGFTQPGPKSRGHEDQSRVGRATHGIATRMDGYQLMTHLWPAAPHQEQNANEALRMAPGNEHTIDRIRALGNAVVPQCVYPIALEISELLSGQR